MKKLTRLAVVATVALLLRASVQAQNLTPVSSTTPNGRATAQPMSISDTDSQNNIQSNAQNTQEKLNKDGLQTVKGTSSPTRYAVKAIAIAPPRYGRNQTVLKH